MRIIKYVVEIIKIEYKQMIAMLLLISLLLILVMSSIMIKCSSNYAYEEIDRVIDVGIDNVAKIATDDSIFGNQSVIDKVNQINGVSFFGTMASYSINDSCFGEFENLQAWEDRLLDGPYIHHFVEIEGRYTEELREFLKYCPNIAWDNAVEGK